VWDKSQRDDGTFSRSEFKFDRRRNVYICPAGETLRTSGRVYRDHIIRYFASVPRCRECKLKAQYCPKARRILRDVSEDARDIARRKMKTKTFLKSRDQRTRAEMRFAHLKTHHGFGALALARPIRCARRVPSRRDRAKSQDHDAPVTRAATQTRACLSCRGAIAPALSSRSP
jgi:hypothetical protein